MTGSWTLAAANAANEREMLFRVMLDDKEIGSHSFRVKREDEREVVDIRADFDIRFFAISFYTYEHDNRETWKNGCLDSIDSTTDDNGDEFRVEGRNRGASFELSTQDGQAELDSRCVMTFAYWNSEFLDQPRLLNSQNGEYLPVEILAEGADQVEFGERSVAASRYRVRNAERDVDITVWYSRDDGRWLSLESRVEGGRVIRYLPMARADLDEQPRRAAVDVDLDDGPRR
jgi:hypothetical protein